MNFEVTWWAVKKLCVPETQWKDTTASYTAALSWLTSSFLMKMKTTAKLLHTCCGQYYMFRIAKDIAVTSILISTVKSSDTLSIRCIVLYMFLQYYQHINLTKVIVNTVLQCHRQLHKHSRQNHNVMAIHKAKQKCTSKDKFRPCRQNLTLKNLCLFTCEKIQFQCF